MPDDLKKSWRKLNAKIKSMGLGGCPDRHHGWETCDFCDGHPKHAEDCALEQFRKAIRKVKPDANHTP